MILLKNEDGSTLTLLAPAKRVVSLVPSITESLILFGAMPVGRTSFCIEPRDKVRSIPVVGGTKNPKVEKIRSLQPDLVIANKEENRKEDVEALRSLGLTVWVNYPTRVDEVVPFMTQLASLCGKELEAESLIVETSKACAEVRQGERSRKVRTVALIWKDPWMAVGSNTYMNDLIERAGGDNLFSSRSGRYPEATEEEIISLNPDVLLLPSEPYSFRSEHQKFWRERLAKAEVELVSGEDLSWFGPRTARGLKTLRELFRA